MRDVVIVGGGIAGSSLAVLLSRGGVDVTVLERTTAYEDRVRGETMPPWGYRAPCTAGGRSTVVRTSASSMHQW